jgi:biopolymer transport protein ExbD
MKIQSDSGAGSEPRIELVPLIDIIFCILTFFLLAGLQVARQQAISVDIPKAATGTPQARELLMVTLDDVGRIFLEQQPIAAPELLALQVEQYRRVKPNTSIVLYASQKVSYSQVVAVLDLLRGVAGDRVALATLPTSSPNPTIPSIPIAPNLPTTPSGTIYPGVPQPTPTPPLVPTTPPIMPNPPAGTPVPATPSPQP